MPSTPLNPAHERLRALCQGQVWVAAHGCLPQLKDLRDTPTPPLPSYRVIRRLFGSLAAYRAALLPPPAPAPPVPRPALKERRCLRCDTRFTTTARDDWHRCHPCRTAADRGGPDLDWMNGAVPLWWEQEDGLSDEEAQENVIDEARQGIPH